MVTVAGIVTHLVTVVLGITIPSVCVIVLYRRINAIALKHEHDISSQAK